MSTKDEILQDYSARHDALGPCKDAQDRDAFDAQHCQLWADCDAALNARKVELQEKPSPTQAEAAELAQLDFMFSDPPASGGPPRDLAAEIDALDARVAALEGP
jgi:hypothetical protein